MRGRDWATLGAIVVVVAVASQWWQDHLAARDGPALSAAAQPGDIQMISSVTCVFCQRAREWMTRFEVAHDECFIERDAQCRERYQALGAPGTPLMVVRGEVQLGFSAGRVLERLAPASAR